MGHRVNEWIQRLIAPSGDIAAVVLLHFGFGFWRILAILLPVFSMLMFLAIIIDPGPKAKAFVEGLKNRLRQ